MNDKGESITNRVLWYVKQLLPMTYYSVYTELEPDLQPAGKYVSVWRMWFGRVYDHHCWQVVE